MNPLTAKITLMKAAKHPLLILLIGIILSSCGMTTYKTSDPRFNQIFSREIRTKNSTRLYRIDPDLSSGSDYHLITQSYFPFSETDSGEIGVLPAGHPVIFNKLRRVHKTDYLGESLLGTTVFRGTTYPVSFDLGFAGDESNAGWKGIYLSFEMPKP